MVYHLITDLYGKVSINGVTGSKVNFLALVIMIEFDTNQFRFKLEFLGN